MAELEIVYRMYPMNEPVIEIALKFDADSFALKARPDRPPRPEWTRLENARCRSCSLPDDVERCPYADALADVLDAFGPRWSTERLYVEVFTPRRRISKTTDMQNAMRSLFGLIGPASGCPQLGFLRPMAQMHLPFSNADETAFRAISMHLMRAWLAGKTATVAVTLEDLRERYLALEAVNRGMAERLRSSAQPGDAALNAVSALDALALAVDDLIETGVEYWGDKFNRTTP